MRFQRLEPFGAEFDEFQLAALRTEIINYMLPKGASLLSVGDVMLSDRPNVQPRVKTPEEIFQLMS